MMRLNLIHLMLFFSLTSPAQIVTGGGTILSQSDENGGIGIQSEVMTYISYLRVQELNCAKRPVLHYANTLMDLYYSLFFQKIGVSVIPCNQSNVYFKCINTKEAQELLKKLKDNPLFIKWVMKSYQLNKEQAESIVYFLDTMDKEIGIRK